MNLIQILWSFYNAFNTILYSIYLFYASVFILAFGTYV